MKKGECFIQHAKVFQAFGDENRLLILKQLQEGERCAAFLLETVPIVQSTLSHHMKILCASGVVTSRKEGKWTYYALSPEGCKQARCLLEQYTEQKPPISEPVRQDVMPTWLF